MKNDSFKGILKFSIFIAVSIGLSGCGNDESKDTKKNARSDRHLNVSKKKAPVTAGKTLLQSLIESDTLYCDSRIRIKLPIPKKYKAQWLIDGADEPYRTVYYSGKNTADLNDDIVHSIQMSYFGNSVDKVRSGKEQAVYVPVIQHIMITDKGRYQWVENADDTLKAIKAMPSIKQGWSMRHVEEMLAPGYLSPERQAAVLKNAERGAYLYAFTVWVDNMRQADEPAERVSGCVIPQTPDLTSPEDLKYLSHEDREWKLQPVTFPLQVLYGSRPRYKTQ